MRKRRRLLGPAFRSGDGFPVSFGCSMHTPTLTISLSLLAAVFAAQSSGSDLSGTGGHRILAQDSGHVAIVSRSGEVAWEFEYKHNSHDIQLLEDRKSVV